MFEHVELAVIREGDERSPFQDAVCLRGEVFKKIAVEEEVASVDPLIGKSIIFLFLNGSSP